MDGRSDQEIVNMDKQCSLWGGDSHLNCGTYPEVT